MNEKKDEVYFDIGRGDYLTTVKRKSWSVVGSCVESEQVGIIHRYKLIWGMALFEWLKVQPLADRRQ